MCGFKLRFLKYIYISSYLDPPLTSLYYLSFIALLFVIHILTLQYCYEIMFVTLLC